MPIENPFNISPPERPIDPGAKIGHVHLKVANIPRALEFYIGVLGFELVMPYGDQAAFISAGGYHHHIGLNTWESLNGSPPPHGTTGLFHLAILYPTRAALADALKRIEKAGIPLDGAELLGPQERAVGFTSRDFQHVRAERGQDDRHGVLALDFDRRVYAVFRSVERDGFAAQDGSDDLHVLRHVARSSRVGKAEHVLDDRRM